MMDDNDKKPATSDKRTSDKEKIKKQVLGSRSWGLGRTAKTEERMRRGAEARQMKE